MWGSKLQNDYKELLVRFIEFYHLASILIQEAASQDLEKADGEAFSK